jgi:hypothetical protein
MSIQCTNSTNYLSKTGAAGGPGTGAFTISAWMRWTGNGSFQQHLTLSENTFNELAGIEQSAGSDILQFYINKSSTGQDFRVSSGSIATNTWVHVAVKWASNVLTAYVNGVNIGTAAAAITTPLTLNYLECGFSDSVLSDVCYYAAALTDAEVSELYAQRQPKRRANLFAYYPCFFGSRTADFSGQGNTATENGTLTDPAITPPVQWTGGRPQRIYVPVTAITIVPSGVVNVTGAAALTAAAGLAPTGSTQVTGSAAMTKAAGLAATGATQATGSATMTSGASAASSGTTQTTGSAAVTKSASAAGAGATQTTGSAAMTAAAGVAAGGSTQTTGTASVTSSASLAATGLTRTTGAVDLLGTMPASGSVQVTGAATMTAAAALAAAGLTRTTGAAALSAAASAAAGGVTNVTGSAAVTASASAAGAGSTQCTGAAIMTASAPLGATGETRVTGSSAFVGTLLSAGSTQVSGVVTMTATAALTASGLTQVSGTARFQGTGAGGQRGRLLASRRGSSTGGRRKIRW